jgi:dTDP-glucose 4,6-dehydratase
LLYVSSGAAYGRQPPDVAALSEDAPVRIDSDPDKAAYARAKRAAEAIVCEFATTASLHARIARCFAFVGPWLPRDAHFAIGNFIGNALRGEPVEVRSRHEVIRSYLHADDLAFWLLRLATADGDRCDICNVGSDEALPLRDVASMVAAAGNVDVRFPEAAQAGSGSALAPADRYVPSLGKARSEFALAVTIPLREAVERTLRALAAPASRRAPGARQPAGVAR